MHLRLMFLQTVLDLVKFDSFVDASVKMKIGPAAISYRLKKVEDWVGAGQLYYRRRGFPNPDNPNLKMTPAGEAFMKGVRAGIENICGARQDAQGVGRFKRVTNNKLRVRKPVKKSKRQKVAV